MRPKTSARQARQISLPICLHHARKTLVLDEKTREVVIAVLARLLLEAVPAIVSDEVIDELS